MLKPPLQPMLLDTRKEPFDSREYIFEFKWDGYRCLTFIDKGRLFLQSRNKKDLTPYFPEFKKLPGQLKTDSLILDGEICMLDDQGRPSFEALQGIIGSVNKKDRQSASLVVWDILAVNQKNIFSRTLMERKEVLNQMISESSLLIKSPYIRKKGQELYQIARKEKIEGIVAKKIDSPYEFKRSNYWLKIKIWNYMNVIIIGYSSDQSSLVVAGKDRSKKLSYMGRVKPALSKKIGESLFELLSRLSITKCPLDNKPALSGVIWVKPMIKCQVRYREISKNYTFRHGYVIRLLLEENFNE